jgi:hypothetical protein
LKKSGSLIPIPAVAITPIPPSFATAEASPESEMPIPIPPWIMGSFAFREPIVRGFNLLIVVTDIHIPCNLQRMALETSCTKKTAKNADCAVNAAIDLLFGCSKK